MIVSLFNRESSIIIRIILTLLILFTVCQCFGQYDLNSHNKSKPAVERIAPVIVWIVSILFSILLYGFFLSTTFKSFLIKDIDPLSAASRTFSIWLTITWILISIAASNIVNWDFDNVDGGNFFGFIIVTAIYLVIVVPINLLNSHKE